MRALRCDQTSSQYYLVILACGKEVLDRRVLGLAEGPVAENHHCWLRAANSLRYPILPVEFTQFLIENKRLA